MSLLALWDSQSARLSPRLFCTAPPPTPPQPRIRPQRTELPHEGASALGRQGLVPRTPRKYAPERAPSYGGPLLGSSYKLLALEPEPRIRPRAGAGFWGATQFRRNLPEMLQICKRAGLDAPLQTAARTWVFFLFFFFLSFFTISAPPTSRAVSACVPPLPKLGGVYYCTNSSSDLPGSLEVALRRRAFRERQGCAAGLRVPGKLQAGLGVRRGRCARVPVSLPLGLLEREPRPDIWPDPSLNLPAAARVWGGWVTPGTMEPRLAYAGALRCFLHPRVERGALGRARDPERGQPPALSWLEGHPDHLGWSQAGLDGWPKLEMQRPGGRPGAVPAPGLALPQAALHPNRFFRP